jgi:hypothetical protein
MAYMAVDVVAGAVVVVAAVVMVCVLAAWVVAARVDEVLGVEDVQSIGAVAAAAAVVALQRGVGRQLIGQHAGVQHGLSGGGGSVGAVGHVTVTLQHLATTDRQAEGREGKGVGTGQWRLTSGGAKQGKERESREGGSFMC